MDDAAAAARQHLPAKGLRAEEVAGQVHREDRVPFTEREVGERPRSQHAGVVDQDLAAAEPDGDGFGGRGDACRIGDVAGHRKGPGAACRHRLGGRLAGAGIAVEQRHSGPGRGQGHDDRPPDPAARTGHHAAAVTQIEPSRIGAAQVALAVHCFPPALRPSDYHNRVGHKGTI
nr:hypothetical protein [Humitalea rosea]